MNERLKDLRKALAIKQGEFAERISTTQGHISDIENGRKELSDRTIKLICLEFGVNETWLRTGQGEMFEKIPAEDEYFRAATELSKNNDKLAMQAVIEYWKLDEDSKKLLKNFILHIAEKSKE